MTIKIIDIQYDTLTVPHNNSRAWWWTTRVTLEDGRTFDVSNKSMTGAFEGDTSREIITSYLGGTLKAARVKEVK